MQVDELAQPDPDRDVAAAEGERKRRAVGQHGFAAPLRQRRELLAREDPAARPVDEAGRDLGAADVDPDGGPFEGLPAWVQSAALTAL